MGHLLYLLGNVNKRTMHKYEQESKKAGKASFAYAWVLDETGEERERWEKLPFYMKIGCGSSGNSKVVFEVSMYCVLRIYI